MQQDLPELGLLRGDRVEPSGDLRDIGQLRLATPPLQATFWRRSCETAARHRNPLFATPDMLSVEAFVVDELHTMHLGVYKYFVGVVFGRLVASDIYQLPAMNPESRRVTTVARLRSDLMAWYAARRRSHPGEPVYALQDLSPTMIAGDIVRAKAAETGSLVPFAVEMAKKHATLLMHGAALVKAGEALLRYHKVTRSSPRRMSAAACQEWPRDTNYEKKQTTHMRNMSENMDISPTNNRRQKRNNRKQPPQKIKKIRHERNILDKRVNE